MHLGNFSISLAVKDLATSRAFYETLGFEVFAGSPEQSYLIMKSGSTAIGLFQGMFEQNILTFNPGWDESANTLEDFTDIRDLRTAWESAGIEIGPGNTDESAKGPAYFTLTDPDGNAILIDQHV